jgi:ribonuclease D
MNQIPNVIFVNQDDQLVSFWENAILAKELFIDTEFRLQNTYLPEPSLLQIMANNQIYIIDLVARLNFKLLADLFNDETITKVIHSALQDLEVLYQILEIDNIKNVFDTQVAAGFIGLGSSVGYGKLVELVANKEISKDLQFSDWMKRPLSEKQVLYAALDVLYLPEIYYYLREKIIERNFLSWFKEDMENLCNKNNLKSSPIRIIERMRLPFSSKNKLAILSKMVLWREKIAIKCNITRSKIMDNHLLIDLANQYNGKNLKLLLPDLDDLAYLEIEKLLIFPNQEADNLTEIIYKIKNPINFDHNYTMIQNKLDELNNNYQLSKNIILRPGDLKAILAFWDNKELLKGVFSNSKWRLQMLENFLFQVF